MGKENIYKILRGGGLTHAGAIAMMGNMMAESSLKSNIAQRGYTKYSDEEYTRRADEGLSNFTKDSVGYGLCQWTLGSRKAALLAWCKNMGVSVGDETAQTLFCIHELLNDFPSLWKLLTTTDDYQTACDRVCDTFERPAVNNFSVRRAFAAEFDNLKDSYSATDNNVPSKPVTEVSAVKDPVIFCLQLLMSYDGYWDAPDGLRSSAWKSKFKEWSTDILNT